MKSLLQRVREDTTTFYEFMWGSMTWVGRVLIYPVLVLLLPLWLLMEICFKEED